MDAQADLHLCYSHILKTGFFTAWLQSKSVLAETTLECDHAVVKVCIYVKMHNLSVRMLEMYDLQLFCEKIIM